VVRKAAFVTLFFLGSLNAASLSALHVDQPLSHAVQCEPHAARPDCHADLPHEHDATHAGEESLFEHIFQMSREAPSVAFTFCVAPVFSRQVHDVAPSGLFSEALQAPVAPLLSALSAQKVNSRAPPAFPRA
jgi:hypothetical protein